MDASRPSIRITRFEPGDERRIIPVFNAVFGTARELPHWTWKYAKNPYSPPMASLAKIENNEIVAHYTAIPLKLNLCGNSILACQSVDTLVHPDYRMHGLFEKTASDFYEQCASKGIHAVFGFPNHSSFPGFMRKLGWRRMFYLDEYRCRLETPQFSKSLRFLNVIPNQIFRLFKHLRLSAYKALLRRKLKSPPTIRRFSTVPEELDQLWDKCRSQQILGVWKDSEYFRWRYDLNPDFEFEYVGLYEDNHQQKELAALAVVGIRNREACICEFLIKDLSVLRGLYLASTIIEICLRQKLKTLRFIGKDIGFFADVFSILFVRIPSYAVVLCGRAFKQETLASVFYEPQSWTITFGDIDTF